MLEIFCRFNKSLVKYFDILVNSNEDLVYEFFYFKREFFKINMIL